MNEGLGYRILPETLRNGAPGFDLHHSLKTGKFCVLEKAMPHESLEVKMSGAAIWTLERDVAELRSLGFSDAAIKRIAQKAINAYVASGCIPVLPELVNEITGQVEAKCGAAPSKARVETLIKDYVPKEWRQSGPKKARKKRPV